MANEMFADEQPESFTDAVERLQNGIEGVAQEGTGGEKSTADLVAAGYQYEFLLRRFLAAYAKTFQNTTPAERTTIDWIYQDAADLLSE